jgi:hypothetical protein
LTPRENFRKFRELLKYLRPSVEYYCRERHLLGRENMRTKKALGFVWVSVGGGWKHGDHFIRKGLKGWTVVLGPYAGTGHETLTEAIHAVGGWMLATKQREAEERAQMEDYSEYLSEKADRERDGFHHAMDDEMMARGLAD